MGHFLGSIYCWFFEEFYGLPLADMGYIISLSNREHVFWHWFVYDGYQSCGDCDILLHNKSSEIKQLVGMGNIFIFQCCRQLFCRLAMGSERLLCREIGNYKS